MVGVDDVGRHVQVLRRKLDESVELVAPEPVVGESLQTDDQDRRQGPDVKLLRGFLRLFALRAEPR